MSPAPLDHEASLRGILDPLRYALLLIWILALRSARTMICSAALFWVLALIRSAPLDLRFAALRSAGPWTIQQQQHRIQFTASSSMGYCWIMGVNCASLRQIYDRLRSALPSIWMLLRSAPQDLRSAALRSLVPLRSAPLDPWIRSAPLICGLRSALLRCWQWTEFMSGRNIGEWLPILRSSRALCSSWVLLDSCSMGWFAWGVVEVPSRALLLDVNFPPCYY